MKKFYDKSKPLGVLRNLEASGTEEAAGLKLEIIR